MRKVRWLTSSLFILLVACGQGDKVPSIIERATYLNLEFEIVTMIEEELIVNMYMTHQGNKESGLVFSSGQMYEIVLVDEKGEENYRFSEGRMFTMAMVHEPF